MSREDELLRVPNRAGPWNMPIGRPAGQPEDLDLTACDAQVASSKSPERMGLWFGATAVCLWSLGSSLIYLGARETGTWRFVAIASLTSGTLQLVSRLFSRGECRTALLLPWRLWAIPLPCFVIYGLVWPSALASSRAQQVAGVNLVNYLWPVLTVLLSVWCVPGLSLTRRIATATGLALAGLVCANAAGMTSLLSKTTDGSGSKIGQFLPYVLASVAAVTWALYSAILARWKSWAKNYVTSPMGFFSIGTIACVVLLLRKTDDGRISSLGLLLTILYGVGPLGTGYLLWERALAKAKVQTLSFLAAATPVLSTLLLCFVLKKLPGPELIAATLLVSGAVIVSVRE